MSMRGYCRQDCFLSAVATAFDPYGLTCSVCFIHSLTFLSGSGSSGLSQLNDELVSFFGDARTRGFWYTMSGGRLWSDFFQPREWQPVNSNAAPIVPAAAVRIHRCRCAAFVAKIVSLSLSRRCSMLRFDLFCVLHPVADASFAFGLFWFGPIEPRLCLLFRRREDSRILIDDGGRTLRLSASSGQASRRSC